MPDIIARIGYVHNVEFLCGYITESEARNYTIAKAEIAIQKMTEKLIDLANLEPKNPIAEDALNKLNEVVAKNDGLQKAQLARGIGVTDPQQIVAYSFAPAQNIDVERLFLNSFLSDRPNILDENVDKYMFLRYISSIQFFAEITFLTPKTGANTAAEKWKKAPKVSVPSCHQLLSSCFKESSEFWRQFRAVKFCKFQYASVLILNAAETLTILPPL